MSPDQYLVPTKLATSFQADGFSVQRKVDLTVQPLDNHGIQL